MTRLAIHRLSPRVWAILGTIVVAGLTVRILAATAGMWMDEAWSAKFAKDVSPFLGVFSSIHHDNNHHLTTLWLQLVGETAPPLIMRALAIATGTATIIVSAWLGLKRSVPAALTTASLFAFAPIMVLYGSEARGYAPMVLAVMCSIVVLDDWLDDMSRPPPGDSLALIAGLGTVSHLMMAPALALLAMWSWLAILRDKGFKRATRDVFRALAPAVIVSGTIIAVILGSAYSVAGGLTVGSHTPFTHSLFIGAITELTGMTTGIGAFGAASGLTLVLAAMLFGLTMAQRTPVGQRLWLYTLLIFAMPLVVLVMQPGNSQFSRYYLLVSLGILFFAGDRIGALIAAVTWRRWLGWALIIIWIGGSLLQIRQLIVNQRGHSEQTVTQMASRPPAISRVAIDNARARAVLEVAAAQQSRQLKVVAVSCAEADYWFVERERGAPALAYATRCGDGWRLIAHADAIGPSGQSWSLYAPQGLPSRATVAKRPLPAR